MGSQPSSDVSAARATESVIPFAPAARNGGSNEEAQLDNAGQAIMRLLHKAAGVAEANGQQALDLAKQLSQQLRAAEEKIAGLEAEVRTSQDRTERAEQWLHKIYNDIEERLIKRPEEKRRSVQGSL